MSTPNAFDLVLLVAVLKINEQYPFYGYRKISLCEEIKRLEAKESQVRRIMRQTGICAIYPKKRTSIANKLHKKYPYLLRNKNIWLPNQVWATDITYIRLEGGYVYLIAVIDLFSRKVLSWRVSNTLDTCFCIKALKEAMDNYGIPAVFNTDQGSQFTSEAFTKVLEDAGVEISMDGVKRALDNIYVERLWRSLKYENIYIYGYNSMTELKEGIEKYFNFYNTERFHQSLGYETPDEIYYSKFNMNQEGEKKVA